MPEYIDREALLLRIDCHGTNRFGMLDEDIRAFVKAQPAADVAPVVHGQWIEDHDYLKCPECGVMVKWDFTFFDIGNWNYCPNCGAKMDGGDSDAAD